MSRSLDALYEPKPDHVRTGTFALAIGGYNYDVDDRETVYGRSWVTLPILASKKRNAEQRKMEKKRLRDDAWPIIFDYVISNACERIQEALQPPQRIANIMTKRNPLGVKQTDVVRACELAGFIQSETGLESFVVLFHAESRRLKDFTGDYVGTECTGLSLEGIVPVAVPEKDFKVGEIVLNKAERHFYDMPDERSFLWNELANGVFLTDEERALLPWNRVVPPRVMGTDYTPFDPTKPVVQPPPNAVGDYVKNLPPDPGVDAALDRLKKVMGL